MRRPWLLLLKHQVGSIVATAVDFGMMIACVEAGGLSAVIATGIGAASGAITSFLLGRRWVFKKTEAAIQGQALRYGLVAVGSLLLNSGGEYVLHGILGLPYLPARVVVAAVVGVLWNYSLQKHFVFRAGSGRGSGKAAA